MAGPGGGPPRRSHTKSRKGCETCKRRHIRCDENFPQCRNCTKHNCRCPYIDMAVSEERSASPEKPDLRWTADIEAEVAYWQQTGVAPLAELVTYPAISAAAMPVEELRLLYHVAAIYKELHAYDAGSCTIWTKQIPLFLSIGASYAFVLNALLALSATHLAWLTECPLTANMAYEHRGNALKGLHEAIGSFSYENSDAVLAASLLLSWQATDWRGWTQLMHGTSSVIDAMEPWKTESQFGEFIAEQSTFPTAPPSPQPGMDLGQPRRQDLDALTRCYTQLQQLETFAAEQGEDVGAIQRLQNFLRNVRSVSSTHTAAQRFEMLNPLRAWLFWMPVLLLQQSHGSATALLTLAHYYAVALAVEPLFPEVGAAYFGSLSLGPVEQIARRLFAMSAAPAPAAATDMHTAMRLLEYPVDMVSQFRARMGWVQPPRTASFPTFDGGAYALSPYAPSLASYGTPISPYGTPTFAYSQEHLLSMPEPHSALSPAPGDVFGPHYLSIPSPGGVGGGYHSPASSNFGDGSMIYNEHGDDFALFEASQCNLSAGLGGFVTPSTIWT